MPPDVAGLPWPEGDPGGLRSAASKLSQVASQLASDGNRMVSTASAAPSWRGQAAVAYGIGVASFDKTFSSAAGSLRDAAGSLKALAAVVDRAQDRVRELAKRVEEAETEAEHARSRAVIAEGAATLAQAAVAAAPVAEAVGFDPNMARLRTAAADASAEAAATNAVAAEAAQRAREIRMKAEAEAERLCDDVRSKDASTAGELSSTVYSAPLGGVGHPAGGTPSSPLGRVIAPTYAPLFRLSSDEEHLPGDYTNSLRGIDPSLQPDGELVYDLSDDEGMRSGDLNTATLPYVLGLSPDGDLQIQYWRFHHYNDFPGPQVSFEVPFTGVEVEESIGDAGIGSHDGDWERSSIQFDETGQPAYVGYDAHGPSHAEEWRNAELVGNRPVVYVAHGGHGSYPESGSHPHSPVDDQADGMYDGGEPWDPQTQLIDGTTDPRLYEDARHGVDAGPPGPVDVEGVSAPEAPMDPDRDPVDLSDPALHE